MELENTKNIFFYSGIFSLRDYFFLRKVESRIWRIFSVKLKIYTVNVTLLDPRVENPILEVPKSKFSNSLIFTPFTCGPDASMVGSRGAGVAAAGVGRLHSGPWECPGTSHGSPVQI